MNIFYLDTNPALCAQYHGDKHVRKMLLEYAQLLCNAHGNPEGMYRPTHLGNRYSVWASASGANYRWLHLLWSSLAEEYEYRFGKRHATWVKLHRLLAEPLLEGGTWTEPPPCDALEGRHGVDGYRWLYCGPKRHLATYTRREAPAWLQQGR